MLGDAVSVQVNRRKNVLVNGFFPKADRAVGSKLLRSLGENFETGREDGLGEASSPPQGPPP